MPHSTSLISTIAVGLALAFLFGFVAARLRVPPLVGYLLAGIAAGPFTPGFAADVGLARQLAEIGVILLMFGVGLHFSLRNLLAVREIALPGAVVQIGVATALGAGLAQAWGWPPGAGLVLGLSLSVASTAVLLRALAERGMLTSINGRIAVGWLIVEDLAMVVMLVLLPALAGVLGGDPQGLAGEAAGDSVWTALAITIAKVAAFIVLMLFFGTRLLPWLLTQVARTGSRELFTLAVIAAALGIAYGSAELFGVSFALGAFFAGVVISETGLSHRAAAESLPLQDAFAVLFFVSVGMLFDPSTLVEHPLRVAAVVAIVLLGKSLAAFAIVLAFRYPINTALVVSASLAQIGEFSFILAGLGVALDLLPEEGQDLILAAALISIALNPLVIRAIVPAQAWFRRHPRLCAWIESSTERLRELPPELEARLRDHAVVIGYGRIGRTVGEMLREHGVPFTIIDYDRQMVEALRRDDMAAIYGDAVMPGILESARAERARLIIITTPGRLETRQVVDLAKRINPEADVVVRTHREDELAWLERRGVGLAVMAELETAVSMARFALHKFGVDPHAVSTASVGLLRAATSGRDASEELRETLKENAEALRSNEADPPSPPR